MSTIFAQSSKAGKAGVSVFRISGSQSLQVLAQLLNNPNITFQSHKAYARNIYHPNTKELIDHALIIFFKSPASFTGEDVVEIHTHGSIAIANLLTEAVLSMEGVRLAEQGEFTKRAFLNGKFDLTSAEGIADLIEAETYMQHKQATAQMRGHLWKLYDSWRSSLLKAISLLEAYIDFPEEDIDNIILTQAMDIIQNLKQEILSHLNDHRKGELIRSGLKLAILGKPNVGKSSLMNFLMQRDVSIVSNISGTTRDVIEGHLDIGGYSIILQDTAGIHTNTSDEIEREGIKRAEQAAKEADIKIVMASYPDPEWNYTVHDDNTISLLNKIDLVDTSTNHQNYIPISLKNNIGLKELMQKITDIASKLSGDASSPTITRARHRAALQKAYEYLLAINLDNDLVLTTEDIRMSMRAIGSITGYITVEEILGEIFANFCIGK